ncbi:MAG: pyridoxal phosphate-dependent aminotransferase family protein [Fibrobacteria bacterium]|nr:pyridoxal phosphate-dependent aminotransferase family protein [Fibrobacteria bacterium]
MNATGQNVGTSNLEAFFQQSDSQDQHLFSQPKRWSAGLRSRKEAMGFNPFYAEIALNEGPRCQMDGRQLIMLGSNNYLGLTTDPRVREAASQAIREKGTSLSGSRLLNGSTADHSRFEAKLARFFGREAALVFTTGYQANVGLLSALLKERGKKLVMDKCGHASIIDGARVAGCEVLAFSHNDPDSLVRILARLENPARDCLVMVDGLYSMEGDIAPLPRIIEICRQFGTALALDEAHSVGTLGRTGHGTEEHFELPGGADIVTGTFSKSLASVGGFVAADEDLIDYIRYQGRSILFSASLPPAQLAAAECALDILQAEPEHVETLQKNARYWRAGLRNIGFDVEAEGSPVVPLPIGRIDDCLTFAERLQVEGVYANCVLYPAVRMNESMIRTSIMSKHSFADLDQALTAVQSAVKAVGLSLGS